MTNAMTPTNPAVDQGRDDEVAFPPEDLDQLLDLARLVENHPYPALLCGPDGERSAPRGVHVLRQVVEVMRQSKRPRSSPLRACCSPQQAADLLSVSRPTLVKLLESCSIPCEKPNRHRRVRLQDLLEFQTRRRMERRAALNQLTEEASELGLYEGSPADYATAVKSARRRRARTDNE